MAKEIYSSDISLIEDSFTGLSISNIELNSVKDEKTDISSKATASNHQFDKSMSVLDDSFINYNRKSNQRKFIIDSSNDDSNDDSLDFKPALSESEEEDEELKKINSSFSFKRESPDRDDKIDTFPEPYIIQESDSEQELSFDPNSCAVVINDTDPYDFKSDLSGNDLEIPSFRSSRSNSVNTLVAKGSFNQDSKELSKCSVSSFDDSVISSVSSQRDLTNNMDTKIASVSDLLSIDSDTSFGSDAHTSGCDDGDYGDSDVEIVIPQKEEYFKRSISPVKEFPVQSTYEVLYSEPHTLKRLIQLQAEADRISKLRQEAITKYQQIKEIQKEVINKPWEEVVKLLKAVRQAERIVKEYSERLAFLNKKIANKPIVKRTKASNKMTSQDNNFATVDLTSDDFDMGKTDKMGSGDNLPAVDLTEDNVSEMGKRALETHNRHLTMTVDALERMHRGLASLENPDEVEHKGLTVKLMPHQSFALNWLVAREKERFPSGGILADDMGLGKTLTMLSLVTSSKSSHCPSDTSSDDEDEENTEQCATNCRGGTLVVCPSSVLGQWENEIKSRVKPGFLSYCVHHGPKREKRENRLARFDVVLTTYAILQKDNKLNDYGPLLKVKWKRLVLDEAHMIRNHKTMTATSAFLLKGVYRWCLTGTPIQNKSMDLFSLLKFLRCRPFDDLLVWKRWVENKSDSGAHRLNCIVKSILLRRTKTEIENLDLKKKNFNLIKVKLDPEEMKIYEKVAQLSGALFAQYIEQKAAKENIFQHGAPVFNHRKPLTQQENIFAGHPEIERLFAEMISMKKGTIESYHILLLLLRLRQLCCHPSLIVEMFQKEDIEKAGGELVESDGTDMELVEKMMRASISPLDSETAAPYTCSDQLSISNPVFNKDRVSSKVRNVIDYLKEKVLCSNEDKALIISQFTSVLSILEEELLKLKVKFCMLTGKVKVSDRGEIISKFNHPLRGPRVMLLSLTAGGTGLNLVGANHLLFVEVHWNPQLENQAFDRVYRIGQKKDVFIYKFICEETIEERILKLQENKLAIADSILTGSSEISSNKLTIQDLKMLFQVN